MVTLPNKLVHLLNEFAVAETLGISVATVRRWRLLRQGPKFIKIGASVRYKQDDVAHWLESRPTGGGQ
jgi:predicted DNA-binding transcriptional regulator AlpA